jgi:hypothetical protein
MLEVRPTMKERYNSPLLLTGVFGRAPRFLTLPAAEGNVAAGAVTVHEP